MPQTPFSGPFRGSYDSLNNSMSQLETPFTWPSNYGPFGDPYAIEHVPLTPGGTHLDFDAYMRQIGQDPLFQTFYPERQPNSEAFDLSFKNFMKDRIHPAVYLLRPTPDDPTIRYSVMKPVGNIPALHLRFWYGPHGPSMGYNFDIFDPKTNDVVYAPKGLMVQYFEYGVWHELLSFPEVLRRCRDLPAIPRFLLPEKWHTNPGTLVRFSDGLNGPVVGEIVVPNAPVGKNPHYECFSSHNGAFVNSILATSFYHLSL